MIQADAVPIAERWADETRSRLEVAGQKLCKEVEPRVQMALHRGKNCTPVTVPSKFGGWKGSKIAFAMLEAMPISC